MMERREPGEKMKYLELSANTVTFINCRRLQLMKATVFTESFIYEGKVKSSSLTYNRCQTQDKHLLGKDPDRINIGCRLG